MKSDSPPIKFRFNDCSFRLRAFIRHRINSGEFTERSLARLLKISQPHLHNMLKGVRRFNIDFADRVMAKFNLTIFDLISAEEVWDYFDEMNPGWMNLAAKRKPPARTLERDSDARTPWRETQSNS